MREKAVWIQVAIAGALVGLFIGSGQTFFDPFYRCTVDAERPVPCPGSDAEYFSDGPYAASELGSIRDYLPAAVDEIPEPADEPARTVSGSATITGAIASSESLEFGVSAATAARIEAAIFDYPSWTVRIDGEAVEHSASDPHGLISFDVPEGEHTVELTLGNSGTARLANWISLASLVAFAIALPASLAVPVLRRRKAQEGGGDSGLDAGV